MKHLLLPPPPPSDEVESAPVWLIVNVCPAILILPVRAAVPALASTEKDNIPLPMPLLAVVMVIQISWLAANQLQSLDEDMVSCPPPPAAVKS
jgi:hypothetical protein